MARKINLTWTQPPGQRLDPRAQRHRHAARRKLKSGPVCVISVIGACGDDEYRKHRFTAWSYNEKRVENLLKYQESAAWEYGGTTAIGYGGKYSHKVRPYWPDITQDGFCVYDPNARPFPEGVTVIIVQGVTISLEHEYESWCEAGLDQGSYWDYSDDVVNSTGIPYWGDKSQWARTATSSGEPANRDYFTHDWATFRSNFKDESITDRDVSQVPIYTLWNRKHDVDRSYAQYNWPSIEEVYLNFVKTYIVLKNGYEASGEDYWMDTTFYRSLEYKTEKITEKYGTSHLFSGFRYSSPPSRGFVEREAIPFYMDYYKISSQGYHHLEYPFSPPLITSGDEESGQAWGDPYNAWDAEVYPQDIKPDGSNYWPSSWDGGNDEPATSWAEAGLTKPVLNATVSDWFALCGLSGAEGAADESGNTFRKVLLYIENNDNETIDGDAYRLFKEKATNAGLVVKCLINDDASESGYYSDVLGLKHIHKALDNWLFYGSPETYFSLGGAEAEAYYTDNSIFAPNIGFDEFGTLDAAGAKIAEAGESLWLDYPSRPDDPTHSANRWFRTEAEAAAY